MNETPNTAGRGRRRAPRLLRWAVWGALAALCGLAIVLIAFGSLMQINAVPADLTQTPAYLTQANSRPRPGADSGRAFWDRPDPPKTFDDYQRFQVAANPGNEGAALYLELSERFLKENVDDAWGWNKLFGRPGIALLWKPGDPLSPSQLAWLVSHQDYIEKLRRMIAAGGPPPITEDEVLAVDPLKVAAMPIPNVQFMRTAGLILAADLERVRASGDAQGAADRAEDLLSLSKMTGGPYIVSALIGVVLRENADNAILAWLKSNPPSPEIALRLANKMDAERFKNGSISETLGFEALTGRRTLIDLMNRRLGEAVQMMSQLTRSDDSQSDDLFQMLVHDPRKTVPSLIDIVLLKADAANIVRRYDTCTSRFLDVLNGPYSGIKSFDFAKEAQAMTPGTPFIIPNFHGIIEHSYASEARSNINRAAVHLLAGETPPAAAILGPGWKRSPWRDPFTDAPLRIEDEDNSILIYSLGPDLKEPAKSSASAGDLMVRIAKPKSK